MNAVIKKVLKALNDRSTDILYADSLDRIKFDEDRVFHFFKPGVNYYLKGYWLSGVPDPRYQNMYRSSEIVDISKGLTWWEERSINRARLKKMQRGKTAQKLSDHKSHRALLK